MVALKDIPEQEIGLIFFRTSEQRSDTMSSLVYVKNAMKLSFTLRWLWCPSWNAPLSNLDKINNILAESCIILITFSRLSFSSKLFLYVSLTLSRVRHYIQWWVKGPIDRSFDIDSILQLYRPIQAGDFIQVPIFVTADCIGPFLVPIL